MASCWVPATAAKYLKCCGVEGYAFRLGQGNQPGSNVCEVLDVGDLCSLKTGDVGLEDVVARVLFGVLGFEPIDLQGLTTQLRLK